MITFINGFTVLNEPFIQLRFVKYNFNEKQVSIFVCLFNLKSRFEFK